MYSLIFAIVDEESIASWSWFLRHLSTHVVRGRQGICLISDRHAGILGTVDRLPEWQQPNAYHRFCLRHIRSNFNSKFKNVQLKDLVWLAGTAHQIRKFNANIEKIEAINRNARRWLDSIPTEKWSLAHDGGCRWGITTSNHAEVFNSVLKSARCLPITACVQLIFY